MITSYIQAFMGLIFVLALIALCAAIFKKYGSRWLACAPYPSKKKKGAIEIVESVFLGTKSRILVLSYKKNTQYVLACHDNNITLIDKIEQKTSDNDHS